MAKKPKQEQQEVILAVKGFKPGLICRDYQFKLGKTHKHDGEVKACEGGFHAIEGYPLEVFDYYAPGTSVFHEVELRGPFARHGGDSKIAAAEITIKADLKIPDLVARAVKWVMDRATMEEGGHATGYQGAASATGDQGAASATGYQGAASATGDQGAASATGYQGAASATGDQGAASATGYQGAASATGYQGAASATGYQGAASATGYQGAASATGYQGAASATGDQGAASATGYQGAASATGYQGAASATGYQGAAMASGLDGRVSGSDGNALFAVERGEWDGSGYPIISVASGIVGVSGLEAGVWYVCKGGNLVPVEE